MWTSALLVQKTSDFSKVMVCQHGQGGGEEAEPVRTFFGQAGRGQFFAILCGRPLWTASGPLKLSLTCKRPKLEDDS